MAEILGAITAVTKLFLEVNQVSIDNWTFKLFYKATTTILLACSIICSSKQFFGNPISCETNHKSGSVNDKVLEQYCWMYSMFNIPPAFKGACTKREHDGTTLYNSYYQWVSLFLLLSALLFYLPRAIWLTMEGGLMKFLARGTRGKVVDDVEEKIHHLIQTFNDYLHNKYNSYAFSFFICEQLNFIVVLCLWFITNKFLKYQFLSYGPSVVRYYSIAREERESYSVNPMCEAFPRIAKCDYHRFGGGGGMEVLNAICILGLNMVNDKIFLIIWFWYLFLTIFGCYRIVYRVLQMLLPRFRLYLIRLRTRRYFKENHNICQVEHYVTHCSYGDWFVLYQMSRNMNRRFFASFLSNLSRHADPNPKLLLGKEGEVESVIPEEDCNKIIDLTYDEEPSKA